MKCNEKLTKLLTLHPEMFMLKELNSERRIRELRLCM